MSNESINRQPSGAPTGGQFATSAHGETGTNLGPAPPAPPVTFQSGRSPDHARLAGMGVGEGMLSLLAPVEAKSVLNSLPPQVGDAGRRGQVRGHVDAYLHWRDLADTGPLHVTRARRIVEESTRQFEASRNWFVGTEPLTRQEVLAYVEGEADLHSAVRRMDAAIADLRYLTDPTWQSGTAAATESVSDYYARYGAQRRFAKKGYRGQVF